MSRCNFLHKGLSRSSRRTLCTLSLWLFLVPTVWGEVAGCDLEYGTTEQKKALDQIMYQGKHEEISSHLSAAQSTRGLALGCPTSSYNHTEPDLTPPTATELENYWRTHFEPILREYQLDCPVYGRLWSAGAWAAYRLADYGIDPDFAALARIGRMQTDTQYQGPVENVEHGPWTGAFGFLYTERRYLFSSYCANTWRALDPDNVIGRLHRELPELFVTYEQDGRTYGGRQFLVGDMLAPEGFYDGGLAYDHGWSAAALLMAAAAPHANADTSRFRHAAILAADWAGREPMSRNHNYTAKLIWFLAEMYRDTGETRYREAMMQKLQLNLLPGILLDQNNDGRVDAVQGAFSLPRFNQLSPVAQVPGRMWDGHNSLPQYQAMNSWAVVAAYVALREHQDEFANNLRPIMRQMLDNMSHEILNLGVPEPGRTQMPIALGLALVDVIAEEPVTRDNRYPQWRTWRDALWAIWNRTHSDPLPFPEALTFAPGVAMTLIASQLFADEAPEPPTAQLDETFDSELLTNWYALDLGRFGGPSDWHTGEGLLKQTSRIRSLFGGNEKLGSYLINSQAQDWRDYRLSTVLMTDSSSTGAMGVLFHFKDVENSYRFSWSRDPAYRRLERFDNGNYHLLYSDRVPYEQNVYYQIDVTLEQSAIEVFIDGENWASLPTSTIDSGGVGFYVHNNRGFHADGIQITAD